jgi:RHS repeat-associated protein
VIAAVSVVLLIICSGIALAAENDAPAEPEQPANLSTPPSHTPPVELKDERTPASQTFLLPGGSRETRIYEAPIHYKDAEGGWKPVESGLEDPPGAGVTNGDNSFDLHLPERMGEGAVRVTLGEEDWIAYRLRGTTTEPVELDAGAASYPSISGGVAFEFDGLANGLKEEIVLADSSAPARFDFDVEISGGLVPVLAEDGSILIRDGEQDVLATLPAPTIEDNAPGARALTGPVAFELSKTGEGIWLLSVVADSEWLASPDRSWPVRIDPTTTVTPPVSLDCTIRGGKNLTSTGGCGEKGFKELQTGFWPTAAPPKFPNFEKGDERARSLLKFNLSSIPAKAGIESAALTLNAPGSAVGTTGVEVRRIHNQNPWNYNAKWPNRDGLSPWIDPAAPSVPIAGGSFPSDVSAQVLTAERGSAAGPWIFGGDGIANLIQGWVTGSVQNNGLIVKLIDDVPTGCSGTCAARYVMFDSSAATKTENRPALSVTYNVPAPASSKVTLPSEGTRTARRLKLKANWTVAGVTGITWQYREGKTGVFHTIPKELVQDAKGEAVSKWPIPLSGVQESKPLYFDAAHASPALRAKGGVIQVRALFEGTTGVGGFSAPNEAKVDRFLGGARDATAEVGPGTLDLLTGNLTVTRTDLSIPTFNSSLDFSRTHNSRDAGKLGDTGVLGQGWKPGVPVEESGAGQWRSVKLTNVTETIEGESYTFTYAEAIDIEGYSIPFEKLEDGTYATPPELAGWSLTAPSATQFVLASPDGTRTTFDNTSSGAEYLPVQVTQTGGPGNATQMTYAVVGGNRRLTSVLAPTPEGLNCSESPKTMAGCKSLSFTYVAASTWGAPAGYGDRLQKITYHAPIKFLSKNESDVAQFSYNSDGRLVAAWDPRISPELKETYSYESGGQLKTITPPGLKPWTMEYGAIDEEEANGRLMAVKRDSLVESTPVAQTTIAYEVPVSGAPYDLGLAEIEKWGQKDVPVDATAIFPADQVPASPPTSYSRATVYYMDADGFAVNTATPAGAGTEAASISTTETDEYGNVVRELTPQNRLRVLAEPEGSMAERAEELETKRQYSSDGTEMREEWGPLHPVRLENGEATEAKLHRVVQYDEGVPGGTTPAPHLPTRETTGASIPAEGADADVQVTETKYNWTLRKPIETVIDPGEEPKHLNIRSVTAYDANSGLPIETRQPSDVGSAGAGTTKIIYYKPLLGESGCNSTIYANLPCKILPAAQPGTAGQPKLLVKHITAYNTLGQPTEITERPGGEGATRKSAMSYDSAGRTLTKQIEGGGAAVPKTKVEYSTTTGAPLAQRFVCEPACEDDQAVTAASDSLGRVTEYKDADGNTSKTTYDLLGRPVTTSDGKGTQMRTYDPTSGLLTKLEDSAAGTFTATYDADGNMVEEGLPNGLVAESNYDETGAISNLTYNKVTSCSEKCVWLDFGAERSINGQILAQTGTMSDQEYEYDPAGRLVQTNDTPTGGTCVTRQYAYDKNSNRLSLKTREGLGSACNTSSGGTEQEYNYDTADRLIGPGTAPTYDDFGRITSLPAAFAGGKTLTTSYFSTDMLASQTQDGVTNTFQLDASLRQRQRTQGGGLEGTEVFHYSDPSDTPSWTQLGANWTRNISGIGGGIGAIQHSSSGTLLQLTNMHGDVVAKASLSTSATEPVATFEYDEFGVPKQGGTPQFGWLGGKGRRTEFPTGVIQMGVRSYVPALGRFLTPDPILGGSDNPYDYANQDPVNNFDLTGEKCVGPKSWVSRCKAAKNRAAVARANKRGRLSIKTNQNGLMALIRKPLLLESLVKKAHQWEVQDLKKMRAAAAAVPGWLPGQKPESMCDATERVSKALDSAGFIATFTPGAQGLAVAIGIPGFGLTVGTWIAC